MATFEMSRPIDRGLQVLLTVALWLVGVAVPFLLLWALNRRAGRFEPTSRLMIARVPVRFDGTGVSRHAGYGGDTEPFEIRNADIENVQSGSRDRIREFSVDDLTFRADTSLRRIFATPAGVVRAIGRVVLSDEDGSTGAPGETAAVPLALNGTWLFVTDGRDLAAFHKGGVSAAEDDRPPWERAEPPTVDGDIVVFTGTGVDPEALERLSEGILTDLPAVIELACAVIGDTDIPPGPDPEPHATPLEPVSIDGPPDY